MIFDLLKLKIMHLDKAHDLNDNVNYILNPRTVFILFIKEKVHHVQNVITELYLLSYCPKRISNAHLI